MPRRPPFESAQHLLRWLAALAATATLLGTSATVVAAIDPAGPQPSPAGTVEDGLQTILDDALAANLELRAGTASVQQRLAALDQARARYLPVLDVAARYSVADGGRTIDIPVGDLLNPVYGTLEELLQASGQPTSFPRVRNEHRSTSRGSRPAWRPAART